MLSANSGARHARGRTRAALHAQPAFGRAQRTTPSRIGAPAIGRAVSYLKSISRSGNRLDRSAPEATVAGRSPRRCPTRARPRLASSDPLFHNGDGIGAARPRGLRVGGSLSATVSDGLHQVGWFRQPGSLGRTGTSGTTRCAAPTPKRWVPGPRCKKSLRRRQVGFLGCRPGRAVGPAVVAAVAVAFFLFAETREKCCRG